MPEITRKVRIEKILTFSIDGRVFSKLENRFDMTMDRNIKCTNLCIWLHPLHQEHNCSGSHKHNLGWCNNPQTLYIGTCPGKLLKMLNVNHHKVLDQRIRQYKTKLLYKKEKLIIRFLRLRGINENMPYLEHIIISICSVVVQHIQRGYTSFNASYLIVH